MFREYKYLSIAVTMIYLILGLMMLSRQLFIVPIISSIAKEFMEFNQFFNDTQARMRKEFARDDDEEFDRDFRRRTHLFRKYFDRNWIEHHKALGYTYEHGKLKQPPPVKRHDYVKEGEEVRKVWLQHLSSTPEHAESPDDYVKAAEKSAKKHMKQKDGLTGFDRIIEEAE